jgi:hypothetical protein
MNKACSRSGGPHPAKIPQFGKTVAHLPGERGCRVFKVEEVCWGEVIENADLKVPTFGKGLR